MNFDKDLYINQIINHTIQGEGNKVGYPSCLVRFNGCNLKCTFCDTKDTWSITKQSSTIISKKNINDFINEINSLNMSNIMITGGEPFLYSNNNLFWTLLHNINGEIEIETNGTLLNESVQLKLKKLMSNKKIKLNISPKLNIGYYKFKEDYQNLFDNLNVINLILNKENYIIKFVYSKIQENKIFEFLDCIKNRLNNIYLMAYTPDRILYNSNENFRKDYIQSCKDTIKACIKHNFKYSPRLQVDVFDNDRNEVI